MARRTVTRLHTNKVRQGQPTRAKMNEKHRWERDAALVAAK